MTIHFKPSDACDYAPKPLATNAEILVSRPLMPKSENDSSILDTSFFGRDPIVVAKELLGQKLVRQYKNTILSGFITETEAYVAGVDSASHAFKGKTARNSIMFGPPGVAYVYFIYGMHHMLNVVTESLGLPSAVLIRGMRPLEGKDEMIQLRHTNSKDLANGPGKLCQALAIDKGLNGWDLTLGNQLWIEAHNILPPAEVRQGPRIGIGYARQEDQLQPWRFWMKKK